MLVLPVSSLVWQAGVKGAARHQRERDIGKEISLPCGLVINYQLHCNFMYSFKPRTNFDDPLSGRPDKCYHQSIFTWNGIAGILIVNSDSGARVEGT